jgi:hypothetical protein
MKVTKKIDWTTKTGKSIDIIIEVNRGVKDNIINLDGDKVNLGKKTNDSIYIEIKVDGKFMGRSFHAPEVLNRKFYNNYDELVAKGAYARLGDTFIGESQYNMIMTAINEAYAEIAHDPDFEIVKAQELIKKQEQEAADKKEAAQYAKMVKNGLCPKCGTYCYGDCEAN